MAGPGGTLRFADFTLDVPAGALMRGAKRLALRRQPFKVLAYLAERSGRLVTNRELIESCWDNPRQTSVNSLAQCIRSIREALGETDLEIIRTVHGQGYVFAAPVSPVPVAPPPQAGPVERVEPAAPATPPQGEPPPVRPVADSGARSGPLQRPHRYQFLSWLRPRFRAALAAAILAVTVLASSLWAIRSSRPVQPTMAAAPSVAVLPIIVAADRPGNATVAGPPRSEAALTLALTLADDITTELSRAPSSYALRIRAAPGYPRPIESPAHAGRDLGVRYLVLGSTHREGDAARVNIQLVEAESGHPLWAEPFTYAPDEPGARNRLAARIARAIQAQVLRAESALPLPARPEAGHYVILGRAHMIGERGVAGNQKAMAYFETARALDPKSVLALHGYARTRVNQVLNRWAPREQWEPLLEEARAAIEIAAELGSHSPGLHVLRGAYLRAKGRNDEAIAAFEHAIYLHPAYPLAHAELGRAKIEVGRAAETGAHIEEAIRLSPTEPYLAAWCYWAGMAEAHVGNYEKARHWLLRTRNENRSYPNTVPWLAIAYAGLGEWEEARGYLKEHLGNFPKFSLANWRLALPLYNPVVTAQRLRLEALLKELGTPERPPETKLQTGLVR